MWMDLGTKTREGLYNDFAAWPYAQPVPNPIDRDTGRWVPHERGSIKRLWESGERWVGKNEKKSEGTDEM